MELQEGLWDYVVVGGGTAGCALANRLSENKACRVVLLEAGDDLPPGEEPDDVLSLESPSSFVGSYRWRLAAAAVRGRPPTIASQARVMGGGSSIMGMVALRGTPDDYNAWQSEHGVIGWNWSGVLPYFAKAENEVGATNPRRGPSSLFSTPVNRWAPLSRQAAAWAESRHLPMMADLNSMTGDGYGSLPSFTDGRQRRSSSICYLTGAVRARPNLRIVPRAEVLRILFDKGSATGVEILVDGAHTMRVTARQVVLAAGALMTPALLMRSGIGPGGHLQTMGVPVVMNRPGVGRNLQNHPMMFMSAFVSRAGRQSASDPLGLQWCQRYSSGPAACPEPDLYMAAFNKTAPHALGRRMATLQTYLLQPASRGIVQLASPDPRLPPAIDFNLLGDARDIARSVQSLRDMAALAIKPSVRSIINGPFFCVRFGDNTRRLNERNLSNRFRSCAAALAIDVAPFTGRLLRKILNTGPTAQEILDGDLDLATHVKIHASASGHHVGTCRMGVQSDVHAVVASDGKVHAVGGLWIADASIMPVIPRGNTNLPTLMIAEKIAAGLDARIL